MVVVVAVLYGGVGAGQKGSVMTCAGTESSRSRMDQENEIQT